MSLHKDQPFTLSTVLVLLAHALVLVVDVLGCEWAIWLEILDVTITAARRLYLPRESSSVEDSEVVVEERAVDGCVKT